MQDIRNELGVGSIRYKIEKRCLERIGHVMRMSDDRKVKAITLGWMEDLEREQGQRKKKTVLCLRKLLREGGIDYTNINKLTLKRKEWKKIVMKKMKHLEKWESRGTVKRKEREIRYKKTQRT